MKLINPSWEIIEQKPGLDNLYKHIELSGRTCYRSLDKITENSSKPFVDRMISSGHTSVLEHGTVYLKIINKGLSLDNYDKNQVEDRYINNPYSKVVFGEYPKYNSYEEKLEATQEIYITTNYRVLVENGWLDDLQYLCEPTEFHEKRHTVKFISNIHFYKDITRHRTMSFSIESTRYCNYFKEKFNNELIFIIPDWLDIPEGKVYWHDGICWRVGTDDLNFGKSIIPKNPKYADNYSKINYFLASLHQSEISYLTLIKEGWKAEQAAEVLPQATKAEIVMTGFDSDWKYIFNLRSSIAKTGKPHPEVVRLMEPLRQEFIKQKWIF